MTQPQDDALLPCRNCGSPEFTIKETPKKQWEYYLAMIPNAEIRLAIRNFINEQIAATFKAGREYERHQCTTIPAKFTEDQIAEIIHNETTDSAEWDKAFGGEKEPAINASRKLIAAGAITIKSD